MWFPSGRIVRIILVVVKRRGNSKPVCMCWQHCLSLRIWNGSSKRWLGRLGRCTGHRMTVLPTRYHQYRVQSWARLIALCWTVRFDGTSDIIIASEVLPNNTAWKCYMEGKRFIRSLFFIIISRHNRLSSSPAFVHASMDFGWIYELLQSILVSNSFLTNIHSD